MICTLTTLSDGSHDISFYDNHLTKVEYDGKKWTPGSVATYRLVELSEKQVQEIISIPYDKLQAKLKSL